jgi:hypothetical protein
MVVAMNIANTMGVRSSMVPDIHDGSPSLSRVVR